MDQANSGSDPSQILMLPFPIPRASLPPSPSLPHFILANRNSLQNNSHHVPHHFPYFVLTHSTTGHRKCCIYQTICKAKPIKFISKLYTDRKTLWVKHATHRKTKSLSASSLSNLDSMFNNNSIFNTKYVELSYKMLASPWFSQPYLWIQPTLQSPSKIHTSTSFNFYLPIPPLLVHKIILTITTNSFSLYLSSFLPFSFCVQPSQQSAPKIISLCQLFSQFRLSQGTRELGSLVSTDTVLISPFFFKWWTMITGLIITDSLLLRLRKLVQSTFSHTLNLLPLLPYPTNNTTRTHIPLETSWLTWFSP